MEHISMKKRNRTLLRAGAWIAFIIYLAVMVYFLFFCEQLGRTPKDTYHYNLEPFAEIKRYTSCIEELGYVNVILNLIGNVVCFMPLGFVLPILTHRRWGVIRITAISCLASVVVEVMQLVTKLGSCDVDDIIMNTLGGLLGYILFLICNTMYRSTTKKKR
jgi:glycopeptide antibiotics resistance protein